MSSGVKARAQAEQDIDETHVGQRRQCSYLSHNSIYLIK